jgi:hypothetical protein
LYYALIKEFKEMRDTLSFESRMQFKLAHAYRFQEDKRTDVLKDVRLAIIEFKEKGGRSLYIPKEIKSREDCYQFLKQTYGEGLKDLGLIITPNLKLIRK